MLCREIKQGNGLESDRRALVYVGRSKKALYKGVCKGACLEGLKNIKEVSVAEMVNTEGREVSDTAWIRHVRSPDRSKDFGFYSRCDRKLLEV